ncbi:YdeI/OmpD-associated family protein [Tsukamurella sp. 8F]|uniref:YdeI/OmpD-associated family protein n=1 Tax=unclassified Tsukamurella TaxID=2633480 RepID=UPI0023B9011E|nr:MULTISPECIES: YdeI/OmpD-associated family protein [unclassified Tsukamurella]MDF0530136.1 YdeI/OmpD-associated family protein [Tsukamurella sp. 8J]MDF0586454.1 YdeI/OmpD-associated family protein [Tsukamurella sp. 8F]
MTTELPEEFFSDGDAFYRWLERNHSSSPGLWLRIAKKHVDVASIDYPAALDAALCFGWIDGQVRRVDEDYFRQRFTPRTRRSSWSRRNRDHVARLTAEGRMRPAGQAAVDAAKADGRWDAAYAGPAAATVPPDLQAALDARPGARDFFAGLTSQNRYAVLYRVETAKRADTRARRIADLVDMLERGETFH